MEEKERKFKVGDLVKIIKNIDDEENDRYVGLEGYVDCVHDGVWTGDHSYSLKLRNEYLIADEEELNNPNVVKIVMGLEKGQKDFPSGGLDLI